MKKIALLLTGIVLSQLAMAQISITGSSLTYSQNFDMLDTTSAASSNLPTGWSIFEVGTSSSADNQYKGNDGSSNSGDTYSYGTPGVAERALGSVASGSNLPSFGVVFTNNTGVDITSFTITYRGEEWRLGSTTRGYPDSLHFLYSTTATGVSDTSATWTEDLNGTFVSPNMTGTTGAIDGNATGNNTDMSATENITIPNGGTLVLKWQDQNVASSDEGLAIDSVNVTFVPSTTPPPNYTPHVVSVTPSNGATNVSASTTNLTITFDRKIQAGTGNVIITNETDNTQQMKDVTSSDVSVNDYVATISNVTLAMAKTYHVTFDSTAFDTSSYNSTGIYDTTAWMFTTENAPLLLDSLNETFDAACALGHLPDGWQQYSVTGNPTWHCNMSYGYQGTPGIQINGYVSGVNTVNEDWLITPELDLSAMMNPELDFKATKEFSGDDLSVLVSHNYTGTGDPNAATWLPVTVDFSNADSTFHDFSGNINTFKAQPMYIAFKYISTASDGSRWTVDNVNVAEGVGVAHTTKQSLPLMVLGYSSSNQIVLGYTVAKAGAYNLAVYDITGREVYSQQVNAQTGAQRLTISGLHLSSGMYIVKMGNTQSFGVAKAIVE